MARPQALSDHFRGRVEQRHTRRFRRQLIRWFEENRRDTLWREIDAGGRRDSYRVWIAEVMLQQTRVNQVAPYFERFMDAFPTVEALASTDLDAVLKCWEGLGYYSRARNLHAAARQIVEEFCGRIPQDEPSIRSLPGVGPYTAAAVLSIAFDKPLAVLDGNVIRVLSRVFAVREDARSLPTRRALHAVAGTLLDRKRPGLFNEAMMELGATVCAPRKPSCGVCPISPVCSAFAEGEPEEFPVLSKKRPRPHFEIAVGILTDEEGGYLVQKRRDDGMLGGLWEFPGGKRTSKESLAEACQRELKEELGVVVEVGSEIVAIEHAYSHFSITLHAFQCTLLSGEPVHYDGQEIRWVAADELGDLAFPRANGKVIEALGRRDSVGAR